MFSLLLGIIYLAFISLGFPDSLIGSGWPVMHTALHVPVAYAGIITMIISANTIISSLLSDRLTRKLGAGMVTAISVLTTAVALFGFSISPNFIGLCFWAVPYGFGAGAVDAALNNFVALHYDSRQMNWLHCFWGVGAAISPYVMSMSLTHNLGWRYGYRLIGIIQLALTIVLFTSLPLWRKKAYQFKNAHQDVETRPALSLAKILQITGVKSVLLAFFAYCALESTAGLWASSFLVQIRHVDPEIAAKFAALFYMGITIGRFLSGIFANRFGDRFLVRFGAGVLTLGVVLMLLPGSDFFVLVGLLIVGFGCAPIYPSIIHSTGANFGSENSQAIIGVQMAAAYTGSTLMPPLFGWLSNHLSLGSYPWYLLFFAVVIMVSTEQLRRKIASQ
ncbi:MFS transporter [Lapidilactobacillus bayanensis]|uniref:MFS transporter n=1 Tax=Lapidilactobacillus bayanensis TaxID=2485998 RepID=UPI000F795D6A|nr:MFS transporter [Lapidilactobacillus bayanensis]